MSSVQCIGEIIANNNVQKEGTEYWNSIEKKLKIKVSRKYFAAKRK